MAGLINVAEARKNLEVLSKNEVIKKPIEVTINDNANIQGKRGTTTAGNYSPQYGDELIFIFNKGSTSSNVTLNIDGSGAKNLKLGYNNVTWTTLNLPVNQRGIVRAWYDGINYQIYGATANHTYQTISEAEALNPNNNLARLISGQILGLLFNFPYRKVEDIRDTNFLPNNPKFKSHHHHFGFIQGGRFGLPSDWYHLITLNSWHSGYPNNHPLVQLAFGADGMYIRQEVANNAWSEWQKVILGNKSGGIINLEQRGDVGINFKNIDANKQFSMRVDNQGKFFLGNPQTNTNIFWANNDYFEFSAYPTVHPSKAQSNLGHSLVKKEYVDNLIKPLMPFGLFKEEIQSMLINPQKRIEFLGKISSSSKEDISRLLLMVESLDWPGGILMANNDIVSENNSLTINERVGIIFHSVSYLNNDSEGVFFEYGLADGYDFGFDTIKGELKKTERVNRNTVNFVTLNGATMVNVSGGYLASKGFYL